MMFCVSEIFLRLRYAWRESIWNWLPSVPAGTIAVIGTGKDAVDHAKVLITSYDLLGRRAEDFSNCGVVIMVVNPETYIQSVLCCLLITTVANLFC